tara:strand:- start:213 stop:1013 length:801 start_codon:yes stop_codon:yes gene_type:complete
MTTEIISQEGHALSVPSTPMQLMANLDMSTVNVEALEKLMDLQERYEATVAKKEFAIALSNFQASCPTIKKVRKGPSYVYAAFDDIMRVISPVLQAHGFSLSFNQSTAEDMTYMKCVVIHSGGHTMESTYDTQKSKPIMSRAGNSVTNLEQAGASSNSFAKRYCLVNAMNIICTDMDDDAQSVTPRQQDANFAPATSPKIDKRAVAIKSIKLRMEKASLVDADVDTALSVLMKKKVDDWEKLEAKVIMRLDSEGGWKTIKDFDLTR